MLSLIDLSPGWTLRSDPLDVRASGDISVPSELRPRLREGVACTVPVTAHAALLDAGLMEDPLHANNEVSSRWVGITTWVMEREVVVPEVGGRIVLEFDGIDTIADVWWDDTLLASTRNMHRRYRFELGDLATPGTHRLLLRFRPPEQEALAAQERLGGSRPNPFYRPFEALRKMACNFGWDWGPDLPSAGLWRGARLVMWHTARLGDVHVDTLPVGDGLWDVVVTTDVEGDGDAWCHVQIAAHEERVRVARGSAVATVRLQDPELWWPRSHGVPHLYDLTIELRDDEGNTLDTREVRVGVRTISLDTSPDERGSTFGFVVNDVPVAVRGLNWIPDHVFPGRTTRDDLMARFTDAIDTHTNLLRVWGGGAYESEDFYDLADELGILVWQDFAFACAAYSEADELADEVRAEALDNVSRLQRRASLALWCGNNECLMAVESWAGWPEWLGGRTWGEGYYFDVLPGIVAGLDPRRRYWEGSPYSGTPDLPTNDDDHGCQHIWDVWNDVDHEHYLDHEPRFVAEFGYQGPPAWATMEAAIGADHLRVGDPWLENRQKAEFGSAKVERGLANHGGSSDEIDTWWWRAQHLQAAAIRLGVAHFRTLHPHCRGYIWWQLNDCWPVISWSVVDSDGRRKPSFHALREAAADRLVALLGHEVPQVRLANETDEEWATTVRVWSVDLPAGAGRVPADGSSDGASAPVGAVVVAEQPVLVPARGALIADLDLTPLVGPRRVLLAEADGVRSAAWMPREVGLSVPSPDLSVSAERTAEGWRVTVAARTLVVDLTLWVDRLDATSTVDSGMVTLLPGESHTFVVTGGASVEADDFARPEVLWHLGR